LGALLFFGFIAFTALATPPSPPKDHQLQLQLRESLPLINVDRVWTELGITGQGVSIVIIDDVNADNNDQQCVQLHGVPVSEIVQAVALDAKVLTFDVIAEWDKREGHCVFSNVADGLRWAVRIAAEQNVRVVNLSFGGDALPSPCQGSGGGEREIRTLFQAGIVVVAAAGNDGLASAISAPACLPEVVSVGATYDTSGQRIDSEICSESSTVDWLACYSNRASFLDVVAPGTTISTPSSSNFGGTSAAAPFVTGVVALMLSANPDLTPEPIRKILRETGDPAYDPVNDFYFPRVNAYQAVRAILLSSPPNQPPIFVKTPEQIFDNNKNGRIDDLEILAALDFWARQQVIPELGLLADLEMLRLLDLWATGTRFLRGQSCAIPGKERRLAHIRQIQ
jgi:subtilisin family serine protease